MKRTRVFGPLSLFIILVTGVVFGGIITYLTKDVSGLSWLSIGNEFGLVQPLFLDLDVLKLTFGLTLKINVAVILGIAISAMFYKFIF